MNNWSDILSNCARVLIGGGGMAMDFMSYHPHYPTIIIDDNRNKLEEIAEGVHVTGTLSDFLKKKEYFVGAKVYNCVGSSGKNGTRNVIYGILKNNGIKVENLILASFISQNVKLGENLLINIGAQIHHDCCIEDDVVISPSVTVCGNVTIKENAFIGAGSIIKQGITIGRNAIIGAGSVVLTDVPDNETWVGNPCKPLIKNERKCKDGSNC